MLKERIGYGFGDMSSSMFWKIFSAYLPLFYAQVFHLDLGVTAVLMLVTRIWDAVSDPLMGIIADRTHSRWGKYRPYLLWIALPFAISGVLLFTTPGESVRTVWAFATYILMMTVYTAINVPYGSMLGVMTADSQEKTVFSSYRMFFAYGGSFLVLAFWEPLVNWFSDVWFQRAGNASVSYDPQSWQAAMIVVSVVCALLFVLTFLMTCEHVTQSQPTASVVSDLASLLRNGPWWIMLGAVLFFNFFGAIRYSVIPFLFTTLIPSDASISVFSWQFAFYAGLFLAVGEVANMAGVACTAFITRWIGKKGTFLACLALLIVLHLALYFVVVPNDGNTIVGNDIYVLLFVIQIAVSILTGIISPLIWSMYADVADYAIHRFHSASTALIFSSSSMAQKFGGAFGASAVLWLLAAFHFDTTEGVTTQSAEAIDGIRLLISVIPAAVAAISALFMLAYPLTTRRMKEIIETINN